MKRSQAEFLEQCLNINAMQAATPPAVPAAAAVRGAAAAPVLAASPAASTPAAASATAAASAVPATPATAPTASMRAVLEAAVCHITSPVKLAACLTLHFPKDLICLKLVHEAPSRQNAHMPGKHSVVKLHVVGPGALYYTDLT